MTIEELANMLVQMYNNAEQDKEKAVMVNLFGIRYANEIGNRYAEILAEANRLGYRISESYAREVYKGVRLAKYVIERQPLIDLLTSSIIDAIEA